MKQACGSERRSETSVMEDNAPDHLARLFAYNDIMRKVGDQFYAEEDFVNDDLVKEATAAYVVSPVSSLVVLETKRTTNDLGLKLQRTVCKTLRRIHRVLCLSRMSGR